MCRDNTGHIFHANKKKIENFSVLVIKTMTIHKTLEFVIQEKLFNVIIESDLLIMIQNIKGGL